jgi:methylthioribulose-1-phosphate dehydratase
VAGKSKKDAGLRETTRADYHPLTGLDKQISGLRETGAEFYRRGWSLGTSSNYSVIIGHRPLDLIVTASGKDKGRLTEWDFVRVNEEGRSVFPNQPKASAETALHVTIAQVLQVGSVLHTHSVWNTLLSQHYFSAGRIEISGFEMLKGLAGVDTHEYTFRLEIFDNTQDIPRLAADVRQRLTDATRPLKYGFLIRRHGLYTWGRDLEEARRHVEILEFLLECEGRRLLLERGVPTN